MDLRPPDNQNIRALEFLDLPAEETPEFQDLILPSPRRLTNRHKTATLQSQNQQRERQENTNRHAPYVSFGDRGTTASAGVYGQLLRICRPIEDKHHGRLHSGLIGLGPIDEPEAWYIYWRASQFLENSQSSANGIGLRVLNTLSPEPPTVDFVGDRWPVIAYKTNEGVSITVRLWCQNNVVVQHIELENTLNTKEPLQLELHPSFCLQDLDYQKKRKRLPLNCTSGPHGYGVVTFEDTSDLLAGNDRICALLGLFKDGEAQKIAFDEKPPDMPIKPIPLTHNFEGPDTVEFTVTVKLQMSSKSSQWRAYMISPEDIIFDSQIDSDDDQKSSVSDNKVLSWHLRRNLEHILSVCSIPVGSSLLKGRGLPGRTKSESKDPSVRIKGLDRDTVSPTDRVSSKHQMEGQPEQSAGPMITLQAPEGKVDILHRSAHSKDRIGPVALTCGDFGDHRVSVSGSYFEFMFMLEMYHRLPKAPKLQKRIHSVCKGHLEWVSHLDFEEACSSNIGIHGWRMDDESGETDLPPDNPTNMPGHIIKATQYIKAFPDIEELLFVCSWLGSFTLKWFQKLAKDKNPLTPTWQHLDDSEIPVYRLSDHVWIWRAFRSVEELIENVQTIQNKMPHETLKDFLQITSHLPHRGTRISSASFVLDFTAEEIRRQNLRRFIIDNDILKRRMLSVTRTARETRFLLHSRDTALYYGLDWGFFAGEDTVWKQLIEAQTQHDEASNDESQWDNPLRYGLAIEMAKEGHRLERTFAPPEMYSHAQQVILSSSSENGLFPGQLDAFSKEPALFDRELFRDFYFHVGFELSYILLRTIEEPEPPSPDTYIKNREEKMPRQRQPRKEITQSPIQRPRDLSPLPEPLLGTVPGYFNTQDGRAVAIQRTLKRQNPYGRLVDLSNIVEVPEEWLYRQQDFLSFIPPTDKRAFDQIQKEAPSAIQDTMEKESFRCAVGLGDRILEPRGNLYVSIDDVRKGRKQRKWSVEEKSITDELVTYRTLWNRLRQRRNAGDSKKRLIYLRSPDYTVASLCYVACPDPERVHLAQFFDRHAKVHANWLYDDTAAVFNSWVTEVHFRFFQFFIPKDGEMPAQDPSHVRQIKSQTCGISGSKAYLVDAVISFRISGDFFDRYWTCYIAQHSASPEELQPPLTNEMRNRSTHWQQRKVLELMLMNRILEKVHSSTSIILRRIEQGPRQKTSDAGEKYFSKDSFEDRKPGELRECFQLLVILKNNITSLQGLVEQWNNRESSQGRERPRWTRNDEQKYRKSIKQKTAHFEDHNREIKAAGARIEFLIALVTNAQDAIRAKKSLREAENITLFTYVTVFFLPVGLAVSVFGMNGIPGRTTIVSMLVTAAVALSITVAVLWCVLNHLIPFGFHSPFSIFKSNKSRQQTTEVDHEGFPEEPFNQRVRRRLSFGHQESSIPMNYVRDLEGQTAVKEGFGNLNGRPLK